MKKLIILLAILFSFMLLSAQNEPFWEWALHAGGTGGDHCSAIATDSDGNSYITGVYQNSMTIGTGTLTGDGSFDMFVAKLNYNGNVIWAKTSTGDYASPNGIALDSSGNCHITGSFMGSIHLGSSTLTSQGGHDIFITKLNANGDWLWANSAGGTSDDVGNGIAVDNSGNLYITGSFNQTADFGQLTVTSDMGLPDVFVVKMNSNGPFLWVKRAGGTGFDSGKSIAVSSNGTIYITGDYSNTAGFGTINLNCVDEMDIFVAKLNTGGDWLGAVGGGGFGNEESGGIAITTNGNCYITGCFTDSGYFGTTLLTSNGQEDIYIAKLDTNLNWLWAKRAGGVNNDKGMSIAADADGNCYATGLYTGTADFGPVNITSRGMADIYVVKLNTNGVWWWTTYAGGVQNDFSCGISLDSSRCSYITGYYDGISSFGAGSITSYGATDIFYAKASEGGTAVEEETAPAILSSGLSGAYPNPFHCGETTRIRVDIMKGESGELSLYNLRGQMISSQRLSSGSHEISFDNNNMASGIYFYRLRTTSVSSVKKLVLLK